MLAVTRPSLLKSINFLFTRTFFGENLQKFIEDLFRNFHVSLATTASCICLLKSHRFATSVPFNVTEMIQLLG